MLLGIFGKILAKLFRPEDTIIPSIHRKNLCRQLAILATRTQMAAKKLGDHGHLKKS